MKSKKEDVIQKVQENHIWINAFDCIRPSDELCLRLGRTIISKLKNKDNLISGYIDDNEEYANETDRLIAGEVLYLSISKS